MFEKLLLAVTITFSLSLFISIGAQSSTQGALASSSTDNGQKLAEVSQEHSFLNHP
ncbi:hypothetical protein K9N68_32020 [Kovacikia minuta CCNUW1]|uniref:hypothetical protein n=1 Tax=Kovacikia minuta TaxID=2931930 RepID=UPI001CCB1D47|nr:hypothetical protein [Kovacikia minuta]UBF26107.1 hypothetical protein K9N68_32020 [Kovacikia minuta CCNUW1]